MINVRHIRTWHRQISIVFLLPLLIIAISGFLLSIRSVSPWIQAPQVKAEAGRWPSVSLEQLWARAQTVKKAQLTTFRDLKSIEVRVQTGTVIFRAKNGYEIQFNARTGEILSSTQRWTPLLVEIHEGNFLPDILRYIIFIPTGVVLIFLSLTGLSIFLKSRHNKKG